MAHLVRATRAVLRGLSSPRLMTIGRARPVLTLQVSGKITNCVSTPRFVSSTPNQLQEPRGEAGEGPNVLRTPAKINEAEFHKLADSFMYDLLAGLEELEEKRTDVFVEYSVCFPAPWFPKPSADSA